ncbi:N-acetylglucosamine kinase [Ornithinibacillus contaminans]|uniref:N-acetylglucosamine kinase n=1 Tax=Ornithinibacillus contaminans TaxID=694055 RepID=UPI00064D7E1C|nr:BadF/BadG/BcrA/BcrD ATPase family protein [Ornithinibacillus contaminans]
MVYVVGIDGGGTKTDVVVADVKGNVYMCTTYGTTNPNTISKQELEETIASIFRDLRRKITVTEVHAVFAGISGAGSPETKQYLEGLLLKYVGDTTEVRVEIDALNALYSGTIGKPGIVQICGTGSITYGITSQGKQDRVGGWGYLVGDEGSGYDIGRRGISAALKRLDGRGKDTILVELLFDRFGVHNARSLIDKIYQANNPKVKIAPVSELVLRAFEKGDEVSSEIVRAVVSDVGDSIRVLYRKLFHDDEVAPVPVVLCGGVFQAKRVIPVLLREELQDLGSSIAIMLPELPPVAGSVFAAYNMIGLTPDEGLIEALKVRLK